MYFFAKPLAGSYAIACILDLIVALEPIALNGYPKLKSFYESMIVLPAFDRVKDFKMYFERPAPIQALTEHAPEPVTESAPELIPVPPTLYYW